MPDTARATLHYVDHDGLIQTSPAVDGVGGLTPKFGIVMVDGATRIYVGADTIGGRAQVTYSVHASGAVEVAWSDDLSEWLAPGTWKLVRDTYSVENLTQ